MFCPQTGGDEQSRRFAFDVGGMRAAGRIYDIFAGADLYRCGGAVGMLLVERLRPAVHSTTSSPTGCISQLIRSIDIVHR